MAYGSSLESMYYIRDSFGNFPIMNTKKVMRHESTPGLLQQLVIGLCLLLYVCNLGGALSLFLLPNKVRHSSQRECRIRFFSRTSLTQATEGGMDYDDDRSTQRQHRRLPKKRTRPVKKGIDRPTSRTSSFATTISTATATTRSTTTKQRVTKRSVKQQTPTRNYSLLDHEILSKEEEQRLGRKVRRAIEIKRRVKELHEAKQLQQLEKRDGRSIQDDDDDDYDDEDDHLSLSMEAELEEFLMRNRRGNSRRSGHYIKDYGYDYNQMEDEESLGLSLHGLNPIDMLEHFDSKSITERGTKSLDISAIPLSNQEVVEELGIKGGREELAQILVDGSRAKEKLIKSNIRLVMSISKKWFSGSTSSTGNGPSNNSIYGSSTRPSLDEVVQEGIMGLAQAVERFEPDRGLKLSTYATFYITKNVRNCFQSATTGCLRVPPEYYSIRIKYQKIVNDHFWKTGKSLDMDAAAENMGLKLKRLVFILRMTEPLIELDGTTTSTLGNLANGGGGGAGSSMQRYESLPTLAESLQW
jgi:DNA-directed RNA polymerase sigma subunit (sigma70/sigma32)